MAVSPSDALVFFGAIGDLAYKKIYPALQAMVRGNHLDVPVVGVASPKSRMTLPFPSLSVLARRDFLRGLGQSLRGGDVLFSVVRRPRDNPRTRSWLF